MRDRRLLAAALLATALGGLHHAIVGTLSPRLIAELGEPDLYVLVAGGYLVATVAGALAAIPLARRFPGAGLLWLALVLLVGSFFLALASTAMWQLVLARASAGSGAGMAFVAAFALAGRRSPHAGLLAAVFGGGFAIGPAVGGLLTEVAGWRWVFAISLAVAIVAAAIVRRGATASAGDEAENPAETRVGREDVVPLAALALASAATFLAFLFMPVAAGSGPGGGWAGIAIVAVPLALATVVGAVVASRLGHDRAALLGLALLALGLVLRAGVGSDRGPGAIVALAVGLGAGLALTGLAPAGRAAAVHVGTRQAAGLVGLALGGFVMLTVMRVTLISNLRPIVELVLVDIPAQLQAFARAAAEGALQTLGDSLNPANLADAQRGFAAIVLERIPAEFQPAAEPYRDALDAAFADALRTGLASSFLVGAALAGIALLALLAGTWTGRRQRARRDLPQSG